MAHVFDITIEASLKDSDLISRLGRFKEDVYRECRDSGATFSDISALNRTLAPFSVTVHSKRGLGRFNKALQKSQIIRALPGESFTPSPEFGREGLRRTRASRATGEASIERTTAGH